MFKLFEKTLSKEATATCALLGQTPLFADLTPNELSLLLPHIYVRNYQLGESVFYKGDPSRAIYFIQKGVLEAYLDDTVEREVLAQIPQGHSIGHSTVLEKATRLFNTAAAARETTLLVLPQAPLLDLMHSHHRMRACIMERFAKLNEERIKRLLEQYCQTIGLFKLGDGEFL